MNHQRLYEYRFRGIDQASRRAVWSEIARYLYRELGRPQRVLDPAAGRCEFINAIPAAERWAVDATAYAERDAAPGVRMVVSDIMEAELPTAHFDAVFVSNFLEHLATQDQTAEFLERMRVTMAPGGRIAVLGPNFRYCAREYFDCADHTLAYTHVSVAEHLYAAGFEPTRVVPRFLPYSFRGRLPPSAALARLYLGTPALWRALGKQFLVLAQRPPSGP
jgi:ubiquinone/menaquinone biosynthesis C-methylase UbiE